MSEGMNLEKWNFDTIIAVSMGVGYRNRGEFGTILVAPLIHFRILTETHLNL